MQKARHMTETTLVLLKPDCIAKRLCGTVIGRFEEAGCFESLARIAASINHCMPSNVFGRPRRKFGQIEWVFIAFGEFDGKISTVEGMMLSPCRLHIALARRSGGLCTIGLNSAIFVIYSKSLRKADFESQQRTHYSVRQLYNFD